MTDNEIKEQLEAVVSSKFGEILTANNCSGDISPMEQNMYDEAIENLTKILFTMIIMNKMEVHTYQCQINITLTAIEECDLRRKLKDVVNLDKFSVLATQCNAEAASHCKRLSLAGCTLLIIVYFLEVLK